MKNRLAVFGLCIAGLFWVSFSGIDLKQDEGGRDIVHRVLLGKRMEVYKENLESSLTFRVGPKDSIRISCNDCRKALLQDQNKKGAMGISLYHSGFEKPLAINDFDKWIYYESTDGELKLVFNRDGYGKEKILIRDIGIYVKTKELEGKGNVIPGNTLEVRGLYFDELVVW